MGSTLSSAFENIYLEYRAVSSSFSSAFKTKHTFKNELWDRHSALHSKIFVLNFKLQKRYLALHSPAYTLWISRYKIDAQVCIPHQTHLNIQLWDRLLDLHSKTFILNIELRIRYSALHSKPNNLWIASYGIDIRLCIRKHLSWISSCGISIQLRIQHHKHFKYRNLGSTFSTAFENIYVEHRSMRSFNIIHTLNIEMWDQHSALHSTETTLWISWCRFSNAELNVDPIARYSKCVWCWMHSWTLTHSSMFNMNSFECRAECQTYSSIFKIVYDFWMQSWISITQLDIQDECWMLNSQLDSQSVYSVECRAERRFHSSIFRMNIFECRTECRSHSSILKVCMVLNKELNVDSTVRYSNWVFSNAELNVEPIARYSKCVWYWMQS